MTQRDGMAVGSRRMALAAVLTALSLVLLYAASAVPSGRLGLTAAAGLFPAAAVVSCGLGAGFLCYGGTAILALLLLADKGLALLYLLFFGLYPMVKGLVERLRRLPVELLLKLAFFNLMFTLFYFCLSQVLLSVVPVKGIALPVVYGAGNILFLLYDFGFSKVIGLYLNRVERLLRRR